jgi:hypothetical protein
VHHFEGERLARLLRGIAAQAGAFVCCEPRPRAARAARQPPAWAIGCNDVTRHDAVVSVHAGFREHELTAAWQSAAGRLRIDEMPAGAFSHLFVASAERDAATTTIVVGGGVAGGTAAIPARKRPAGRWRSSRRAVPAPEGLRRVHRRAESRAARRARRRRRICRDRRARHSRASAFMAGDETTERRAARLDGRSFAYARALGRERLDTLLLERARAARRGDIGSQRP